MVKCASNAEDYLVTVDPEVLPVSNYYSEAGWITCGGYDLAYDVRSFNRYKNLYGNLDRFAYRNTVPLDVLVNGSIDKWKIYSELRDNSVKYLLIDNADMFYIEQLFGSESQENIKIEEIKFLTDESSVVILDGIQTICQNEQEQIKRANVELDEIDIYVDGSDKIITCNMSWNKNLKAEFIDGQDNRTTIPIEKTEKYTMLFNVSDFEDGRIHIFYVNYVCYMQGALILFDLFALMVCFVYLRKRKERNED